MQMQFPGLQVPLTVSEINRKVRYLVESQEDLQDCWVTGEISNVSRPASGHIYLTLKDSSAQLRAVIWKREALRLQRIVRDGILVEAHGSITVYETGGQYQLTIDEIRLSGEGELYAEFIRLKNKLESEGLFSQDRKIPLPDQPKAIGIVTSPSGAALQDLLQTISRRYPVARIVLSPASVQGVDAPLSLLNALTKLLKLKVKPDVIIIARGGGSIEDLWAFNNETLVRAIAECPIPVISGVGHETDFTLVDFVADVRAPTPTGAAELATPNSDELKALLMGWQTHLDQLVMHQINTTRQALQQKIYELERKSPEVRIQNGRQTLDFYLHRMNKAYIGQHRQQSARMANLQGRLKAIDPFAVLQRGYAMVENDTNHQIISSVSQIHGAEKITIRVSDGSFGATTDINEGKHE